METLQNSQPVSVEVIKQHAKRIGVAFNEKGIKLKHSEVLDIASRGFGFNNYQTAKASAQEEVDDGTERVHCRLIPFDKIEENALRVFKEMLKDSIAMIASPMQERMEFYVLLGMVSQKYGLGKVYLFTDEPMKHEMRNCLSLKQEGNIYLQQYELGSGPIQLVVVEDASKDGIKKAVAMTEKDAFIVSDMSKENQIKASDILHWVGGPHLSCFDNKDMAEDAFTHALSILGDPGDFNNLRVNCAHDRTSNVRRMYCEIKKISRILMMK